MRYDVIGTKRAVLGLMLVVGLHSTMPGVHPVQAAEPLAQFDVAENHKKFTFDQNGPLHDDGMPAYGNAFITQGYIYPHGTLDDADGVLESGEPQFPDKVMGAWTCYGHFVNDGAHTKTGPWVVTKQVYEFEDGTDILVSEGFELADVGKPVDRALTGGTGSYAKVEGEIQQTFLGFHPHEGVKLRFNLQAAEM